VGNLRPHKNVAGLLRAFALAKRRAARDCQLLIIGDDRNVGAELLQRARKFGLNNAIKIVPRVSDDTLRAAYRAAEMTVLPSFEEGFGLPVLESMASGTPVACSFTASMPEVGGTAAQYFDPASDESIAATIERVLTDSELRSLMRRRGLEQAKRFTWESCAEKVFSVYQHVAGASAVN
jgi:glycosyltransferase involved in cell wall biosynthesis